MARCAALLLLLLLLFWAGPLRGAQEAPPPADLRCPRAGSDLDSTLDLLWSGIGRIVRSAVEPPIAGLDGRLTGVQLQLNGVSSELEARVESAETKLEARVESAETKLEARVESAETKLEARLVSAETKLKARVESAETKLEDRVESAETKLEDRVESAQKQLEARMDDIQSEQVAQTLRLTGRLSHIESALEEGQSQLESRLEAGQSQLESRLEVVQSQLESRLEGFQSQLESRLEEVHSQQGPVRDCSDLPAGAASGVHLLLPGLRQPVPAYCDMATDGGGWTVIQRRADILPRQDFFLGWEAYKWGFGELDAEFWWGLKYVFQMTSLLDRRYQIRFDLEDFDGEKRYALYQGFRVASEEDGYRVTATNYTGNAGDSFSYQSGQRFTTKDRDQDVDKLNCAEEYEGAWWFKKCHHSHLNGLYLSGNHSHRWYGVNWLHWRGDFYSLKSVEMKIKPSKKL